jgi:hypothetical protein
MNSKVICPICEIPCTIGPIGNAGLINLVKCPRCKDFQISVTYLYSDLSKYGERYLLCGAVRNLFEKGSKPQLIHDEDFKKILDSTNEPKYPFEKIDLLIKYIHSKNKYMGDGVEMNSDLDYPLLYAKNSKEFQFIVDQAKELKYIEPDKSKQGYRLALGGWERLKELLQKEVKSHQAFVAMWFDKTLDDAWEKGFKPALEETGYEPIRIDSKEHNEKICDVIIAEIRDSGLLVADFTGQRGGVYFEAGFAKGLGIPVIWTCRKDHEEALHFDTRQYNHIIWEKPEELKKKLVNRIRATL